MDKIQLKYGNNVMPFSFPENSVHFSIKEPQFNIDEDQFYDSINNYLKASGRSFDSVAIVVSDKTRLCGYDRYLPWLLKGLQNNKIKKESIAVYIAYGTHPRQSDDECTSSYGEVYNQYRFIHHDCKDDVFTILGKTSKGTEIKMRKDVLDRSLIITYGAISHHYFAGFGGGRKLLFPGLAEKKAIYQNHSLFLDFENRTLHPGCQPGKLEGNPIAEDLKEVDVRLPERLSIHGILDSTGRVCKFMFGTSYSDFEIACQEHHSYYRSGNTAKFDLVVASAGGYPKDINYIQSHKAMHNAAMFVRDGGTLVLLAECRDGIGNDSFLSLFKEGGWDYIFDKLKVNYAGNGGTALATLAKTSRINIKMVTELSFEDCQLMGIEKMSYEEANQLISDLKGTRAFLSNASMLVR